MELVQIQIPIFGWITPIPESVDQNHFSLHFPNPLFYNPSQSLDNFKECLRKKIGHMDWVGTASEWRCFEPNRESLDCFPPTVTREKFLKVPISDSSQRKSKYNIFFGWFKNKYFWDTLFVILICCTRCMLNAAYRIQNTDNIPIVRIPLGQ